VKGQLRASNKLWIIKSPDIHSNETSFSTFSA